MTRHTLVPFDDSDPSHVALEHALTEHADDDLTVLYVVDPSDLYDGIDVGALGGGVDRERATQDEVDAVLESARELATAHDGPVSTDVMTGAPSRVIVDYAQEHAFDHIVLGSHGRTGTSRILLGSVAEAVARRASIPVTIVR